MKTAPWIIIVVLLALLIIQRECQHVTDCPEYEACTLTHCDSTTADSIPYPVIEYIPVPETEYQDTGSTKWRYYPVDTGAIIADYLKKRFYGDTLLNDTNGFVAVYDSVFMNRIIWRKPVITLIPTIVTKTNTYIKPADPVHKLFIGMGIGRKTTEFGLAPSLMYISKKDHAYTLSYDILHRDIYFTMYYKLSFIRNGR